MKVVSAVTVLLAVLCVAMPAAAAPVTILFVGSIDLSVFGGGASSTVEGSAIWDTSASPAVQDTTFAYYLLDSQTLKVNGIDVSAGIADGSTVRVFDDPNTGDDLTLTFPFYPLAPLDLGAGPDIGFFFVSLLGLPTMFSGTGIPQDLAFLASVNFANSSSAFTGFPYSTANAEGTVTAHAPDAEVPVPEPGSIVLLGSGIVGAALRKRPRPTPAV